MFCKALRPFQSMTHMRANNAVLAGSIAVFVVTTVAGTAGAQQKRPITFDDFAAVRNVTDPQPSPDGKLVLYNVRTTDVSANRRTSRTFVVAATGGSPQAFPSAEANATEARRRISFRAPGTMCRPVRSVAAKATTGRPTDASSRIRPRIRVARTRGRPTSTSTPWPPVAARRR